MTTDIPFRQMFSPARYSNLFTRLAVSIALTCATCAAVQSYVGPQPQQVDPSWSPGSARLVFTSEVGYHSDLFVVNADGTGLRRLTDTTEWWKRHRRKRLHDRYFWGPRQPDWSPDGELIAFAWARDGDADLYLIEPDGSGLRAITRDKAGNGRPQWSPDGRQIAFLREKGTSRAARTSLCLIAPDGSRRRGLSDPLQNVKEFSWSPDSSRIAYSCQDAESLAYDVYVVEVDTAQTSRLSDGKSRYAGLSWSADGSELKYGAWSNDEWLLILARIPGFTQRRLGHEFLDEVASTGLFSPVDDRIAFVRGGHLAITRLDSAEVTQVSQGRPRGRRFVWSPDGGFLAYTRTENSQHLWVTNTDGSGEVEVSSAAQFSILPSSGSEEERWPDAHTVVLLVVFGFIALLVVFFAIPRITVRRNA